MSGFFKDNPPATQVGSEDATESTIQEDAVTQTDTSGGFFQGSPDQTTTDAYTADALASKNAAEAAKTAAEAAQSAAETAKTAAETAETNAETAETNAETAETNAEAAETNAAASQSAAATSATSAAGSATTATTKAGEAATSATNAAASATSADTAKTAAETAETNAETAETNAASSASSASTSASNASTSATAASGSASAASTSETNAASSATAAATSATNAATSETNAASSATSASNSATTATTQASTSTTQAGNSATSATAASNSASSAASAQTAAEAARDSALAALDSFDDRYLGSKSSAPTLDNDGNALVSGALYFDSTANAMKVYDGSQWLNAYASLSGALIANQNLSDLDNAATARTNLGLGSAATTDSTAYATAAQGTTADNALAASSVSTFGGTLIDDADAAAARTTLGLGTAATTDSSDYATAAQADQTVALTGGSGITTSGTYPNFTITNSDPDQTVALTGAGATTISGTYPNFTISSTDTNTDTNTEYTAGSGITLTGTVFSNSAPDQTVALTGSGGTTVSGTYPNFTISSAASIDGTTINPSAVQIGGTTVIDSNREGSFATRAQFGGVDSAGNVTPSSNNAIVSGYGMIGNRGTFYVTNNGKVQIGNGSSHNGDSGLSVEPTVVDVGSGRDLAMAGTTVIDSSRRLRNLSGELRADNTFKMLTESGAAQLLQTKGVAAGTSYGTTLAYEGEFNALNGYRVGNTAVIDSSRNLTNIAAGTFSGLVTADRFRSGLGTAASPAFQVGDTNTGFFDSGSNTIGVACNGAHKFNFTTATLDMKGNTITNGGNITLYNSATDARYLHLPRGGGITMYGDASAHHGIFSRNSSNDVADDILISSYGAVYFDLDSNSNNSSGANFEITRHNGTAALFKVDGETYDVTTLGNVYIPSRIYHSGDTDTYMQFHAANQWRVVAGGSERIEVNGSAFTVPGILYVRNAIDLNDNDILRLGSSDDVEFFCNGSHMYMDLNSGIGNFYIRDGTTTRYTFNDNGSFTATGNITAYSDRRVKAQFEPITDALAKVQRLHGQTYIRTDMDDANRRYAGLIAQDVEAVLPEAVTEIEDHLALDYSGTIGLLVEAIKELKQEVNDLKAQLEDK